MIEQLIDYLIESIQGPCIDNQLNLARKKIVEISKDLLTRFPSQMEYKKRGFFTEEQ